MWGGQRDPQVREVQGEGCEAASGGVSEEGGGVSEKSIFMRDQEIEDAFDRLKEERDLLQAELRAMRYTIVVTVGGTVEGRPTCEINYLQRLRHLRRIETAFNDMLSCFDTDRSTITGERVEAWRAAAGAP